MAIVSTSKDREIPYEMQYCRTNVTYELPILQISTMDNPGVSWRIQYRLELRIDQLWMLLERKCFELLRSYALGWPLSTSIRIHANFESPRGCGHPSDNGHLDREPLASNRSVFSHRWPPPWQYLPGYILKTGTALTKPTENENRDQAIKKDEIVRLSNDDEGKQIR